MPKAARKTKAATIPTPAQDAETGWQRVGLAASSEGERRMVPYSALTLSPLNPRKHFDAEKIAGMVEDIHKRGIIHNLHVRAVFAESSDALRPDIYEIVAGATRYKALGQLIADGRTAPDYLVPVLVQQLTDREVLEAAMAENLGRNSLSPMEEAEGFAALRAQDVSTREIASACVVTMRYVQQRLALVDRLAPETKKALDEGQITFSHARALTMAKPKEQKALIEEIADRAKNADDWEGPMTEQELKREITSDMAPVAVALFERGYYTGEIVVDEDTGVEMFADAKLFKKLQDAAIKAKAKELQATHAEVHIQSNFYEHDYRKAKGDEKAIAIIETPHRVDEPVKIHTGLVKKTAADRRPAASKSAKPAKVEPEDAFQKSHRNHAHQRKTKALQRALMMNPPAAARLVCASLLIQSGFNPLNLTTYDSSFNKSFGDYRGAVIAPELIDLLKKLAGPIIGKGVEKVSVDAKDGFDKAEGTDTALIWNFLVKLKPNQVADLMAALVAVYTASWCDRGGPIDDDAECVALAEHLGIAGKEAAHGLTLELGDLEGLRKPALLGICARLKITQTTDGCLIDESLTTTAIRNAIADKIEGNAQKLVLPTLTFASGKDMDDAVKALIKEGK